MDVRLPSVARGSARWAAPVAAASLVLCFAFPVDGAAAHAYLTHADPAPGAELDASPDEVTLTYDEPVTPAGNALTVLDGAGTEHRLVAEAGDEPGQLRADLAQRLVPGRHQVTWRVLPADGHVLEGTFTFTVVAGDGPVAAVAEEAPATTALPGAGGTAPGDARAPNAVGPTAPEPASAGAASGGGSWAGAAGLLAVVGLAGAALVGLGRQRAATDPEA